MIRTSRFGKDAKDGNFLRYLFEDCRTIYDCFRRGAKESSKYLRKHKIFFTCKLHTQIQFSDNGICLGWRESKNKPYQWIHYNEALLRARNFGCGLVHLGQLLYTIMI